MALDAAQAACVALSAAGGVSKTGIGGLAILAVA
jgi:hypothetical protein